MLDTLDDKTQAYIREIAAELRAELRTQVGVDRVRSIATIGMNDAETAIRMLRLYPDTTREVLMGCMAIGVAVCRQVLAEQVLERDEAEVVRCD